MKRLPVLLFLLLPATALAQTVPFGKNKIQYRNFDWRVLAGEHVDVYYYPEEETLARLTLVHAEETIRYLAPRFQFHPFERIPLIVYSSHQHFEQTNVYPGFVPEGVLGFTEYLKGRVALPFRGDYAQFRQTLRHELVHYFQLAKLAEVDRLHGRSRAASPRNVHWWTEGLAEYFSTEMPSDHRMYIQDMVFNDAIPTIQQFGRTYSFASYPLGAELHRYLAERFGERYILEMYEKHWKYDSFEDALAGILGMELEQLSREWEYDLQQRYFPVHTERPPLDVGARPLIHRGPANYKPTLHVRSDDKPADLFFVSSRNGYTNVYRTRVNEGEKGVETVVRGQRSAELESLHAFDSRIDVNGSGVVAFVSKYLERDALIVWDQERDEMAGRYQWPDLVALRSPTWSPDDSSLIFEGLTAAGLSDLYRLDFDTQERTRLTNDRFRDADPDWSPDARHIVFTSDRTVTGAQGHTNLFLLELESGEIRYLTHGPWKDQHPRWSRDGKRVAFSSDRAGNFDLYAVDTEGNGRRLTSMTGGAFDPEWLPNDEGLVFGGFSEGRFLIYRYAFPSDTAELPTVALGGKETLAAAAGGGELDPVSPPTGWDWAELSSSVLTQARDSAYHALHGVSLDVAGGDALVAPGIGGAQGAQFLASDMLGDHIAFAGLSAVQGDDFQELVDNFSGNLLYLNLSRRLNVGAGLFRFRGLMHDVALNLYEEETYGGYFLASYPFSRYQRVELRIGVEHGDRVATEEGLRGASRSTRIDPQDLTRRGLLTSNFISFVKDNTLWFDTGPIDGERYNITAGLVTCFACKLPAGPGAVKSRSAAPEHFVLIGDYRRYFRTSLMTAYAVRLRGFFSGGAIPARSVLGGTHQLRGYPRYSLAGSRVAMLNQEWRFPLLHGLTMSSPIGELRLPGVRGALFTDIGSSWLEEEQPTGLWGSYGIGFRASLGAPLVLRLDVGRRFRIGDAPPVSFDSDGGFGSTFVDFFFGFDY